MNHEQRFLNRLIWGRPMTVRTDRTDHGTHKCYVSGCRCDACTDAEAAYSLKRKQIRRGPSERPLMFCRDGRHRLCPVVVAHQPCSCGCHAKQAVA